MQIQKFTLFHSQSAFPAWLHLPVTEFSRAGRGERRAVNRNQTHEFEQKATEETERWTMSSDALFSLFSPVQTVLFPKQHSPA
jgi:hypothetical protein